MTFGREKRLLLGWLALVAPLPLPLNEPRPDGVVGWLFLLLYVGLVAVFLRRAHADEGRWLGPLALNLLGLAYLPALLLDLTVLWRGHLVRPMMHLVLFALVVKLFALRNERDKWQVAIGIFFVFVTSMATSSSPGIVLYMMAFLVLGVRLLTRFAHLHVASLTLGSREPEAGVGGELVEHRYLPIAGALVMSTIVGATPLFVLLPRLNEPYILGRGGDRSPGLATGFSDEVSLDAIGQIRTSREVAIRVEFSGLPPNELRLRGGAFDEYLVDRWEHSRREWPVRRERTSSRFRIADGSPTSTAQLYLEPLNARSLILPVESLTVEFDGRVPPLSRNRGGAVTLPLAPATTLSYRVGLSMRPVEFAGPPRPDRDHTLDIEGVSQEIVDLAATVAGDGADHVRAARIERHLSSNYEYTLDFVGREPGNAIYDFLFRYRSGHCEYFATAMVLMLRSEGIPARFVTGFLGGELNPLGYTIVRQSNAHAWVEAYLPDRGWTIFDPTPPAGRPSAGPRSLMSMLRQAYDFVLFRWDRYVISYGVVDQAELMARLRAWVASLFDRSQESTPSAVSEAGLDGSAADQGALRGSAGRMVGLRWTTALLLLTALILMLWWRRPVRTATRAYLLLRQLARRHGVAVDEATPPQLFERRLERRCPAAASSASRVVSLYLRESYREESLSEREVEEAEEGLREVRRSLRRAS